MKTQVNAEQFLTNSDTGERIVFYECDPRKNKLCRKNACKPLGRGDDATGCDATTDPKAKADAGRAFYIYCAPGERVGLSRVYISNSRRTPKPIFKVIKWSMIVAASILLFVIAKDAALRERGYEAIGGEYMILLLPAIYYAAERTVKDWIADLRGGERKEHRK